MTDANDTSSFLGPDRSLGEEEDDKLDVNDAFGVGMNAAEPAEVIVSRVLFALLVSVSLSLNLLLLLAVVRSRRQSVHVIYCLSAAMLVPDLVFYAKLVVELVDWSDPTWAKSDWSCALWQFATHLYPILYAVLLLAVVYHAFVTLFLDYSGGYEEGCKRFLPFILAVLLATTAFIVAPSAIYSKAATTTLTTLQQQHPQLRQRHLFRQYCELSVPSLLPSPSSSESLAEAVQAESSAAYRLAYELVLPYLLPLAFLGFPYVALLLGLLRSVPAASHSEHSTKMTVVVTLWLVTSYLMLHVASVLRNVFSVLSVWHRLLAVFDAYGDERVPRFQTYVHIAAYAFTCLWAIVRVGLCFKYNARLRKALGP